MKRWTISRLLVLGILSTIVGTLPVKAAATNAPATTIKPPVTTSTAMPAPAPPPAVTTSTTVPAPAATTSATVASDSTPVVANPDMVCPVLSEEKADKKYAKILDGKIYYFCCARCVTQFTADPKKYIAEMENHSTLYAANTTEKSNDLDASTTVSDAITSVASAPHEPEPVLTDEARLKRFIGYFHPALVHFPIALIITAALAECLLGFTGRRFFAPVSIFCIRLAAFLVVLTAASGWIAASGDTDTTSSTAWVLDWHRWLGVGTAVLAGLAATISLWITHESERGFYRWMLYLTAIAVGVTGHFGGMLVYGLNYFRW